MKWYDEAVFYHIYPLGLCGCPHENNGQEGHHFEKLKQWAVHSSELGCTAIYIGPLFESVGHGYETTDYRLVDRRLGTNDEFRDFVKYCHDIGLRVIVDGVFNHVGRRFFAFEDVLKNRENSEYCSWFCNLNFSGNNEYNDGFSYENWGGYNLLVKLNVWNPQVRQYLFDSIAMWVHDFDIDGIRLDAADVLDFQFMKEMRQFTDGLKEDFWLMGEVIHGDYSRWANDETLHAVTNYELHKGLYSGHNDHNYFEIAHSIRRINDICRGRRLYTFVDNHDVERIASKVHVKKHLELITILLYTIYGIPSVYYGSEFAIEGKKEQGSDWNLRPCLELSDFRDMMQNNPVTRLHAKLGRLKKEVTALREGGYQELSLTNRQFAFGRVTEHQAAVTALNSDDAPAVISMPVPIQADSARDLLGMASGVSLGGGRLTVELPANTGTVVLLTDGTQELPEDLADAGTAEVCGGVDEQAPEKSAGAESKSEQNEADEQAKAEDSSETIMDKEDEISCEDAAETAGEQTDQPETATPQNVVLFNITHSDMGLRSRYIGDHYELTFYMPNYDSVQNAYYQAVSQGAEPVKEPYMNHENRRSCEFKDAMGNHVVITALR